MKRRDTAMATCVGLVLVVASAVAVWTKSNPVVNEDAAGRSDVGAHSAQSDDQGAVRSGPGQRPHDPEALADAASPSGESLGSADDSSTAADQGPAPSHTTSSAGDFYHWRWSTKSRPAVRWSFTNGVPSAWRAPITTAVNSWNAERRSLQYTAPGRDLPPYQPQGCTDRQLESNGVHHASLDGPDGIVATTFSCVDVDAAEAVSIQVVVDADDRWFFGPAPSTPGEYDLIGAVAHEFGHATGWEGHYAPDDPHCTSAAHLERMCPALLPGSTAWRTTGSLDRHVFSTAY